MSWKLAAFLMKFLEKISHSAYLVMINNKKVVTLTEVWFENLNQPNLNPLYS